jgi:hypothetical protein
VIARSQPRPDDGSFDADTAWPGFAQRLRWMAAVFGAPADLAADGVLARADVQRLRAWLGALETLARALLVRLAAEIAPRLPAVRVRRGRSAALAPATTVVESASDDLLALFVVRAVDDDSSAWRGVAFRHLPPVARRADRRCSACARPSRFVETLGCARRFEALIRVAEAPERYARRLARRLVARPDAAGRVLTPLKANGPAWLPRAAVRAAQDAARTAVHGGSALRADTS